LKHRVKGCFSVLLALTLTTGFLWLLGYLAVTAWRYFSGLQKEVAVAIVAGAVTITVSVVSIVIAKYYERKRAVEQELREKKIPMYYEFVEFWFSTLYKDKIKDTEGEVTPEEHEKKMLLFLKSFTQKLMVWGSDEVVGEWSRLRRSWAKGERMSAQSLFEFERLLLAIRRDAGHSNKKLKRGDLLGLFINDLDEPSASASVESPTASTTSDATAADPSTSAE